MESSREKGEGFLAMRPYYPPKWALHLNPIPSHFISLAQVPTPIHKWNLPGLPPNTEVYIKRDDLTGVQLSGNKARKLEFLLANAISLGADCVITMGGIQSNHCRATAVAAKYVNLDCYLIMCRSSESEANEDPGLSGNLLIERLVGANIELASWDDFSKYGSLGLLNSLKELLVKDGRKPYVIPCGGSNSLGTWGYIEAIHEIENQQKQQMKFGKRAFDDIVAACGSSGTVVGLSLGSHLSTVKAAVHAFSIGEDVDNYYGYAQGLLDEVHANLMSRNLLHIQDVKGLGYAISTQEEILFIKKIAEATGVILDPVYSGKAAYGFYNDMVNNPKKWEGRKVLFIHTGGIFGLYDKAEKDMFNMVGKWHRMTIDESLPAKDASHFW
ncbi:hypothetical protein GIB67_014199 [Kingdonia uniflora]|uniref:Tryptophan synthase beta chain-like PALP domain-containing protein n=1 Tax=Kingdonia uniflora TaxID=39325 RepID=A0A7J7M210_9MAGN|nr:hypothetical protein GIB67_014199 [Kingdonia uniflora]